MLSLIGGKVSLVLGAILVVTGLTFAGYFWYSQNKIEGLNKEVQALEVANSLQIETIDDLETHITTQNASISTLQTNVAQAEEDSRKLANMLRRHDLEELSRAKPGLIETRVNNGTKQVFNQIEELTREKTNE